MTDFEEIDTITWVDRPLTLVYVPILAFTISIPGIGLKMVKFNQTLFSQFHFNGCHQPIEDFGPFRLSILDIIMSK